MENSTDDPNPWGFLKSLQEGQDWVDRLDAEMMAMLTDLLNFDKQLSEASYTAIAYTIRKTRIAIEQLQIEMKMFES